MEQRTILISGCSDGSLGCQLALAFKNSGYRVFATARSTSKLSIVSSHSIETILLDTTSDASITECVDSVSRLTGGSLDILFNNAGAGYSMPLLDLDLDRTRDVFELNAFSLIRMTRAFMPLLRKSTVKEGGLIVNNVTCTALNHAAMPFSGAYNASKAAALNFSETLRNELAPFGIRVTSLLTGSVKSTFRANAPDATLPDDSIYNVAKVEVEKAMRWEGDGDEPVDAEPWAKGVVKDISKTNPPLWIWRGQHATTAWLGSFLPVGALDVTLRKMTRLDVVEERFKEQEQLQN